MLDALVSENSSADIPVPYRIYDWLVGSWQVAVKDYESDGTIFESVGEWYFSRVLEGRAIQDVWICPARAERSETMPKERNRYGTSIRFFDADKAKWQVIWINPVSGTVSRLVAEQVGNDIVQIGVDEEGNVFRWIFTDIRPATCRWYGERTFDRGLTWTLEVEFFLSRAE